MNLGSAGISGIDSDTFKGICVGTNDSVPVRAVSASVEVASVAVSNLWCNWS